MQASQPSVRPATRADSSQLLELMRELAAFEGYLDRFAVREADLLARGFPANGEPEFRAFVAEDGGALAGYAVVYVIPFTFDLRPTLVLKELFVSPSARSSGIGRALYGEVIAHGRAVGARMLRWQVLPNNERAMKFYRSLGGDIDSDWQNWMLEL